MAKSQQTTGSANVSGGGSSRGWFWKVGIIVLMVAGAATAVMSILWGARGGGTKAEGTVALVCTNPQCQKTFTVELAALSSLPCTTPRNDRERPAFKCALCGQMTAICGVICPQCGKGFRTDTARRLASGGYECPSCHADTRARAAKAN
jgi:hypothetical protein